MLTDKDIIELYENTDLLKKRQMKTIKIQINLK